MSRIIVAFHAIVALLAGAAYSAAILGSIAYDIALFALLLLGADFAGDLAGAMIEARYVNWAIALYYVIGSFAAAGASAPALFVTAIFRAMSQAAWSAHDRASQWHHEAQAEQTLELARVSLEKSRRNVRVSVPRDIPAVAPHAAPGAPAPLPVAHPAPTPAQIHA